MSEIIISTCGTSIFTNCYKKFKDEIKLSKPLPFYSNLKYESDFGSENEEIKKLINLSEKTLLSSNINEVTKLSAELNAIVKYYKGNFKPHSDDIHYLISTSKYPGKSASNIKGN